MILAPFVLAFLQQTSRLEVAPVRPRDPFVFRCVLDKRARMLVAALDEEMWVAWDTSTGGFYKAWKGGVSFDGAVYTTVHGPQPTSKGPAYAIGDEVTQWSAYVDGKPAACAVAYQGYAIEKGELTLEWKVTLPGERGIVVREQARFGPLRRWWDVLGVRQRPTGEGLEPALQRSFSATGLRGTEEIRLAFRYESVRLWTAGNWVNGRIEEIAPGVSEAGALVKTHRSWAELPLTTEHPQNSVMLAFEPISLPAPIDKAPK